MATPSSQSAELALLKALEGRWAKVHRFEADLRAGLSGPPFEFQRPFETERLRTSATTRPAKTAATMSASCPPIMIFPEAVWRLEEGIPR